MPGAEPRIDVEWLAFAAGLKPAIRIAAAADEADAIATRYRARGAAVVGARGLVGVERVEQVLLYIARTTSAAAAACAAEGPILVERAPADVKAEHARELGLRLGYPACCIDTFVDRVRRGFGRLAAGEHRRFDEDFVAAHDARAPRCDWRLNHLLLRQHLRLVSFEPCRHDCAAGITFADAVAQVVAPVPGAAGLFERLRRPLVITADGARAWVTLARAPASSGLSPTRLDRRLASADAALVAAEAPRGAGVPPSPRDEALAARLLAVPLSRLGEPPPLLLDFSAAAGGFR